MTEPVPTAPQGGQTASPARQRNTALPVIITFTVFAALALLNIAMVVHLVLDLAARDDDLVSNFTELPLLIGSMVGLLGVGLILTVMLYERSQSERSAHREAEAAQSRLKEALEAIDDGFAIYGTDGRLILCNARYRSMRVGGSDIIHPGVSFEDIVRDGVEKGIFPQAKIDPEGWIRRRLDSFRSGNSTTEQRTRDGRWVVVSERRMQDGCIVTLRSDITEIRHANGILGAVSHAAQQFLLQGDWRSCIEEVMARLGEAADVSAVITTRLGQNEEGAAIAWTTHAWVSPDLDGKLRRADLFERIDLSPDWLRHVSAFLDQGEVVEVDPALLNGQMRQWMQRVEAASLLLVPIFVGKVRWGSLAVLQVGHDRRWLPREMEAIKAATAMIGSAIGRDEMDAAMRSAREEAEAANAAKSEFLAMMSHELRTPMNGLLGMVKLLQDSGLDNEQAHFAEVAVDSGEALLTVINDILDFSRLEAGRLELVQTGVNLRGLVESVLDLMAVSADERGLEVVGTVAPDIPPRILGDSGRLRQILLNLVGNAVKFTEAGGFAVRVNRLGPGGNTVEIMVEDSGVGISETVQPHLFNAFMQGESTLVRRFGGTGLGLAICKRLTDLMGGNIRVESRSGEGSRFYVTLPLRLPARAAAEPQEVPHALAGRRVALFLQERLTRGALEAGLVSHGASIVHFSTPQEAVAAMAGDASLLLVIDGGLWPAGGIAGAEAWLSRIVALTGMLTATDQPGLPQGMTLVPRPVTDRRIIDALEGRSRRQASAPVADSQRERLSSVRVLLAEDSRTNQLVVSAMLEGVASTVEVVESGEAALEKLAEGGIDVVLMDMLMPGMDGAATARAIRTLPEPLGQVPIIGLTGNLLSSDGERAIEAGMNAYLSKPVERDLLLQTILDHIEGSEAAPRVARRISRTLELGGRDLPLVDARLFDELAGQVEREAFPALVRSFINEIRTRGDGLAEAAGLGDIDRTDIEAHTLRSSARTFGAVALAELATEIETAVAEEKMAVALKLAKRAPEIAALTIEAMHLLPSMPRLGGAVSPAHPS